MTKKTLPSLLILPSVLFIVSFLVSVFPRNTYSATNHIVISEIKLGDTGATNNEFVELYNPTDNVVDLSGWEVLRKTAATTSDQPGTSVVVIPSGKTIPAHGYFLLAHTDYTGAPVEDVTYTDQALAANNAVLLQNAADTLIDKVGLGTAVDVENTGTSSPSTGKSVERKAVSTSTKESMAVGGLDALLGNGEDTDNNANDFLLRDLPEPQNTASSNEPVTMSPTATATATPTPTNTPTNTATATPTNTPLPSLTPTGTVVVTPTSTPTNSPTNTITLTPTLTPTNMPTVTPTSTLAASPTPTLTPTAIPTNTSVPTLTVTPTNTPTPTLTPTFVPTQSPSPTPIVLGTFDFPNRRIVCTVELKIKHNRFISWIIPKVKCEKISL